MRRWEGGIRMNLREVGYEGADWIRHHSWLGPVAGSYEHGNEPSGYIKGAGLVI